LEIVSDSAIKVLALTRIDLTFSLHLGKEESTHDISNCATVPALSLRLCAGGLHNYTMADVRD